MKIAHQGDRERKHIHHDRKTRAKEKEPHITKSEREKTFININE